MKAVFLFAILLFSAVGFTDTVPDGCPTDDPVLIAAVESGQRISCQITYFTGGRGGRWVERPITPNPQETIELACIDSQNEACPGIAMCLESPYFSCKAQSEIKAP